MPDKVKPVLSLQIEVEEDDIRLVRFQLIQRGCCIGGKFNSTGIRQNFSAHASEALRYKWLILDDQQRPDIIFAHLPIPILIRVTQALSTGPSSMDQLVPKASFSRE